MWKVVVDLPDSIYVHYDYVDYVRVYIIAYNIYNIIYSLMLSL